MKQYVMYKIACEDVPDYLYIGCTVNFRQRKCAHKSICTKETLTGHNRKLYKTIRDHGGWENWTMSPIETYECETKIEAHMRETELMSIHTSNLNSVVSYRSEEDAKEIIKERKQIYCNDNKELIQERRKQYRNDNKELIQEQKKRYSMNNKEIIKERNNQFRKDNKAYFEQYNKQYREENKERIKEQKKQYRMNNKEIIKERNKQYRENKLSQVN
jgi:hypothetical protein